MMTHQRGNNKRDGGTRTKNMKFMSATELVSQLLMSSLKAPANYSPARDAWSRRVSGDIQARGQEMMTHQRGNNKRDKGTRTKNMPAMVVTELVSQLPMSSLKAKAAYIAARDGLACG